MKWVLLGMIALLIVVAVVVAIGAALPKEHVARTHASYRASPDTIWAVLTDVAQYPTWRSGLKRVEVLPPRDDLHVRWREHDKDNAITFEEVEATPPAQWQVRIADEKLPFGGTWTYELVPIAGDRTDVAITENGVVHNPLFRFMARFVFGYHATQEKFLRDLGRAFSQDVEPERLP